MCFIVLSTKRVYYGLAPEQRRDRCHFNRYARLCSMKLFRLIFGGAVGPKPGSKPSSVTDFVKASVEITRLGAAIYWLRAAVRSLCWHLADDLRNPGENPYLGIWLGVNLWCLFRH
jgi:hypothetical protein